MVEVVVLFLTFVILVVDDAFVCLSVCAVEKIDATTVWQLNLRG